MPSRSTQAALRRGGDLAVDFATALVRADAGGEGAGSVGVRMQGGAGLGPVIPAAAAAAAVVGDGDGDGEGYGEGHGGGRGEGKYGDEDEEGSGVERALARSVSWAEGVESPAAVELVPVLARRADSLPVIWASLPMPEDVEGAPRDTRGSIGMGMGRAEWA